MRKIVVGQSGHFDVLHFRVDFQRVGPLVEAHFGDDERLEGWKIEFRNAFPQEGTHLVGGFNPASVEILIARTMRKVFGWNNSFSTFFQLFNSDHLRRSFTFTFCVKTEEAHTRRHK